MNEILIQSALFSPIQQMSWIMHSEQVLIEQHDTYAKQTFRNRIQIAGPNGLQSLSIPITKPFGATTKMKDVIIDYNSPWQMQFLKSIKTAYQNSAFYEYYIDDIASLFELHEEKLIDYNLKVLAKLQEILEIDTPTALTNHYTKTHENDFREVMHPKPQHQKADSNFNPVSYHQVFIDKFGFLPNLSIIDLIFNEGPLSYFNLKKSFIISK